MVQSVYHKLQQSRIRVQTLIRNRWIRLVVQGIILTLCLFYLGSNLRKAQDGLVGTRIDYLVLFISWLLTTVAVFLGALGWWFTLRGLGQQLSFFQGVRIHMLSNLAKYIPGYAWQLVGKAYLTREQGLISTVVGLAMALEFAQLIWIGLALSLMFLPTGFLFSLFDLEIGAFWISFLRFIGLLMLVISPLLVYFFSRWINRAREHTQLSLWRFVTAAISILSGWLLFGFAYWLIGKALTLLSIADLPLFVFTLFTSFVLGLVIIIVPASIGVRESIMVFILSNANLPASLAVVIAVLSRIIVMLSELTGVFLIKIYLCLKISSRNRLG